MPKRLMLSIEVEAPASTCYRYWSNFEEFPRFMAHVKRVTPQGENRWLWEVDGPLGQTVSWEAIVDGEQTNHLISWHSVSGPDVGVQGAVRFEVITPARTQVTVTIQYEAPGGILGGIAAELFANPEAMVRQDLENFKRLAEGTMSRGLAAREEDLIDDERFNSNLSAGTDSRYAASPSASERTDFYTEQPEAYTAPDNDYGSGQTYSL